MAVITKIIKKENNNKPSLVITKHGSDGEERNSLSDTVPWNDESDDEDHLYELIRGVPAVIVSNGNSQSKRDFIPKRNSIGRNFFKTDENGFLVQRNCFENRKTDQSVMLHDNFLGKGRKEGF